MHQSLEPAGLEKDNLPPLYYGKNRANGRFKEEFNSVETDKFSGSLGSMDMRRSQKDGSVTGCGLKKSHIGTDKIGRNSG